LNFFGIISNKEVGLGYIGFEILDKRSGLRHCITTRDPERPLEGSLALHTGDDPLKVQANRRALAEYFGPGAHFVSPLQVHGDHVHVVSDVTDRGWEVLDRDLQADALVTDRPGVVLTILTADCVPILLYDPVHRAIGAVHAGWRGTRQEITPKTVRKMGELYGTDPADLIVGIGPAIGGCCYEVGAEVAEHFTDYPESVHEKGGGKYLLDTKQINAAQLVALGIPAEQIEISPICTMCDHERFFSYRAHPGETGRFMSCIALDMV
jgi:YfiH family protein